MNDPPDQQPASVGQQQTGCEDVRYVIDPHSDFADDEMKITLLETLRDQLPRLPMLRLFKIQKIDHDADDSSKSLRKKLNAHFDLLKSVREGNDEHRRKHEEEGLEKA